MTKGIAGCPRTPLGLPWAFDAGVGPSYCMVHHRVSSAVAKIGDRPCPKLAFPWHGKVAGSATTAVHMPGRVWPGADDPWGHCKAIRRRVGVGGFMAVHHTLKPPARAGFWLLCTKFGTSERGFLVCGDGTGGLHAWRRVLLDAPGPHLTCHGRLMRAWVPPIAWRTVAYRLQAPKLVTGRAGSSPSPWHGKVAGSAMTAVHMPGRVLP